MRYSFRKLDAVKFGNLFQFSKKSKPQNFAAVKFNFKSVRVEDGTLTEITDLFLEMLQSPTAQQQICPSGVQQEYVTSREQWVRLKMDLLRKKLVGNWGNVKVCPLIPI